MVRDGPPIKYPGGFLCGYFFFLLSSRSTCSLFFSLESQASSTLLDCFGKETLIILDHHHDGPLSTHPYLS